MKLKYILCAFALATAVTSAQDKPAAEPKVVSVDTELLLLVEVPADIDERNFQEFMQTYAKTFHQESVVDAIRNGAYGSIAASLMFYGGETQQTTAVGWTQISDSESASSFSQKISEVAFPFVADGTNLAKALSSAYGNLSQASTSGFEGTSKIVDFTGFNSSTTSKDVEVSQVDSQARDTLLSKGVTAINGLALNSDKTLSYFKDNVTGGENSLTLFGDSSEILKLQTLKVATELNNANAVPEPSSVALLGLGMCSLLIRRKR